MLSDIKGKETDHPEVVELKARETVVIPNNKTVAFRMGRVANMQRKESGPPTLSRLPYVNRLFTNVAYARQEHDVLVLITPKVIINPPERNWVQAVRVSK